MRQYTKIITLYNFDELNDDAKEKAREWWRTCLAYDEWWDGVYEDAARANLKISGFDLDRSDISGQFMQDAITTADAIIEDHGVDCETYKTASKFRQERDKLVDEWPKDEEGELEDEYELDNKLDELENEFLHDILEDYRIMLRKELEYQESDENVDESIRINEYTFDINGKRQD